MAEQPVVVTGRRTKEVFADAWDALQDENRRLRDEVKDLRSLVDAYRRWVRECPIREI